jgi:hypothetical protein
MEQNLTDAAEPVERKTGLRIMRPADDVLGTA